MEFGILAMELSGCIFISSQRERARVRVRRRSWNFKTERQHLDVTAEMLMELFGLRATEAAARLGVSTGTFQRMCRRLGIAK